MNMDRIAVISDIHGNISALETVLSDIKCVWEILRVKGRVQIQQ